jgi:hypothetical protein
MNFIKNILSFHADVIRKIKINKGFFLFAATMYLLSDFIVFLQPIMSSYFSNPETDAGFASIFIKWGLFIAIWMAYFVSASLLSVYFVRKDKNISKIKYYLKPLINMRVYGTYFFLVFGMLFSFFIATKFLPEVANFISEGVRILSDATIADDQKMDAWMASPVLTQTLENTAIWQWLLATISFVGVLLALSMSILFTLPLVVKNKGNTLYSSLKRSFNGAKSNFVVFLFSVLLMIVLKYLVPSLLDTVLPSSFIEMMIENRVHYATRPLVSLYDALLFFYVIIGLEKFVLTNDKK